MLYAGLDLGTYLFRFVLARKNLKMANKFEVIKSDTIVINFGIMEPGKMISEPVTQRMERAFSKVKDYIAPFDVKLRCVGTAALRYSPMASDVIENLSEKFGIHVEIISPAEEIYLAALGCQKYIASDAVVIDIGSGSSELAYVIKTPSGIEVRDYVSLNLGLLNNLTTAKIREEEFTKLENFAIKYQNKSVVCSKCTTLKIAYNYFHKKNQAHLNGKMLEMADLKFSLNEFYKMKNDFLRGVPGIGARQVKLVKVGLPWVHEILHRLRCKQVMLCENGLKEGIVLDLMSRFGEFNHASVKENSKLSYSKKLQNQISKWINIE